MQRGKLLNYTKYFIFLLIFVFAGTKALSERHLIYKARTGDGITTVLEKFFLPSNKFYIEKFRELNASKIDKNDGLFLGSTYRLPILIKHFDGKDLNSSLNISTQDAQKVDLYNKKVFSANLKGKPYRKDKKIWLPYSLASVEREEMKEFSAPEAKPEVKAEKEKIIEKSKITEIKSDDKSAGKKEKEDKNELKASRKNDYSYLGKKNSKIKVKSNKLKGKVYYIDPGHGGCDPGAIGKRNNHELHEDEYAYDISLRLAKLLLENGAKVFVIVVDPDDGIRNDDYLKPDDHEYYYGMDTISLNQKERLQKRADIINSLFQLNKKSSKKQTSVTIHIDSRFTEKRIDVFFYYKEGSDEGEMLAETLKKTISDKYEAAQPGRGYNGSVSSRNLLMLRELKPVSVYIELGNLQNKNDQYRFIKSSNRQTIAKWLCDGLIKASKEK